MTFCFCKRLIFGFMSDLALKRREDGYYDLVFDGKDLQKGESLESAVVVSIGSFAREAEKVFKNELQDDGWWAEPTFEGDRWGCMLHTLSKRKNDSNLILLAEQYVDASLRWLVEDGVVDSVKSEARSDDETLDILVVVSKGDKTENYRYDFLWNEVS